MYKNVQLHPVATDKKDGPLVRWNDTWHLSGKQDSRILTRHLYVTSDEEIREGDEGSYILHPSTNTVLRIKQFLTDGIVCMNTNNSLEHGLGINYKQWRKIVATSDKDLIISKVPDQLATEMYFDDSFKPNGIALIPQDLKQYFADNQGKVKEIMVEFEPIEHLPTCGTSYRGCDPKCNYQRFVGKGSVLKLTPQGEIIWRSVEEKMYTREEIIKIFHNTFRSFRDRTITIENWTEWFDKHYPK